MKSIVIIITNLSLGGAERWVANMSRLLVEAGHQVEVIIFENIVEQELSPEVKLTVLDSERRVSGSLFARRRYARNLRRIISSGKGFDLAISTLPYADQVAHMAGVPRLFCRIANTLSREIARLPASKARRRHRRYQRIYRSHGLIAVSEGVREDLIQLFEIDPGMITTIYNPIDVDFIRNKSKEVVEEVPAGPYLIHSGRFTFQKRHDVLLDAWNILRKREGGRGLKTIVLLTKDHEDLQKLIAERGLESSVLVTGAQKNPYPWVKAARCLVLSSEREGMPNVILESLALGVPVASTDCPSGPRELLGSKYPQALAKMNDPVSLADAIEYSLDEEFAESPEILAPFLPACVASKLLSLIES